MKRMTDAETSSRLTQCVERTIERMKTDERFRHSIPLARIYKTSSIYKGQVHTQYIVGLSQVSKSTVLNKYHLIEPLNTALINHGVILPNVNTYTLNRRNEALFWWLGLTRDEKLKLDIFGNKLHSSRYLKKWESSRGFKNGKHDVRVRQEVEDKFNQELLDLGVLKTNYVKVKGRAALRDKNFLPNQSKNVDRWSYLSGLQLDVESDLIKPCENKESFVQVKQLFSVQLITVSSISGRNNYRDGFNHFCLFLNAENIPENSFLKAILNEFILIRFKQDYLMLQLGAGTIAPEYALSLLSAVRCTLRRATKIKGLDFTFYDATFDEESVKGRVTDTYKPYSKAERAAINAAIQSDIAQTKALMCPYKKSGIGENPLCPQKKIIQGKGTLDNARYFFENELNCRPVFYNSPNQSPEQLAFLRIVNASTAGLHDLYRSWGVIPFVDRDLIAPFIYRLAQITGMNADCLATLELDDLVLEHPVTGKPCLRYWKERSTGQKELHLDLFEAKLQWLTTKQSECVVDIFDVVKILTSSLRINAPDEIVNILFIYKNTGFNQWSRSQVTQFFSLKGSKSSRLSASYSAFTDKHGLINDKGERLQFNVARFRPSFVSELIEDEVSIREIQFLLGHSSIMTTMKYLDRMDIDRIARRKVKEAINCIHSNVITHEEVENKNSKGYQNNSERIIFRTPMGGCTNIFNPPEFIRKSKGYSEGQSCSQYNKCLSCENVMITASHLPDLFAMRRDYTILIQGNRIMETPYGIVVSENLTLLDEILSPDKSEFTIEELNNGERLSRFVETAVIDSVGG